MTELERDLYEALKELLCWFGPGTPLSCGAKCEMLGEAMAKAEDALIKARNEICTQESFHVQNCFQTTENK